MSPDDSIDMSIKDDDNNSPDLEYLKIRVNAIKGLIALLNGETDSGSLMFGISLLDQLGSDSKSWFEFALYQQPSCLLMGAETLLKATII
jgi:hypothetical protein